MSEYDRVDVRTAEHLSPPRHPHDRPRRRSHHHPYHAQGEKVIQSNPPPYKSNEMENKRNDEGDSSQSEGIMLEMVEKADEERKFSESNVRLKTNYIPYHHNSEAHPHHILNIKPIEDQGTSSLAPLYHFPLLL